MANSEPATKRDVEEIIGRVVGEIAGEAMQLISKRFDKVEAHLEPHDDEFRPLKATVGRIESKLDATADIVDEHSQQIKQLQIKPA